MREVRPMRESNGRLPHAEYKKIAAALDIRGFKLLDCLEHRCHKLLAEWNQKHPRNAVVTFQAAIEGKLNWLHRGVQKRLNRAEATYSKLSAR